MVKPFVLGSKITTAYRGGGFLGCLIYGAQRLGKSSYALQNLKQIYGNWDDALKHTYFTLEDVVGVLDEAVRQDKKIPALLWDDAGVHANKLLYFQNRALTQYLSNLLDVVGTSLGGLIITTPTPHNLLKVVRGYEFYRVKVFLRDGSNGRTAVGYNSSLLPSGFRVIRRKFSDYYNVLLPDDVWAEYSKQRKSYLIHALKNLRELLKSPPNP